MAKLLELQMHSVQYSRRTVGSSFMEEKRPMSFRESKSRKSNGASFNIDIYGKSNNISLIPVSPSMNNSSHVTTMDDDSPKEQKANKIEVPFSSKEEETNLVEVPPKG